MPGYFSSTRLIFGRVNEKFFWALRVFVTCVLLFFWNPSLTQRVMIDSLKESLISLQDSARIDCLNVLSLAYAYINIDTARLYAKNAYKEASAIGYLRGEAMALNNSARIAGHALHDFQLQEKISLQVLQLFRYRKDEMVSSESYMNLALAYFYQSDFDRSAEICDTIMQLCKKTSNKKGLGEVLSVLGSINFETGNYEKSFAYFNESLGVFKSINDSYNTAILLTKIGDFYRLAGDNKTALNFYFQSLEYPKGPSLVWHPLVDLGDTYYSLEPYDTALHNQENYIQTIKSLTLRSNYHLYPNIQAAEWHIARMNYDLALTFLFEELAVSKKRNDGNQFLRVLLGIARAYEGKHDYKKAFLYTKKLLEISEKRKAKPYLRDGYNLMHILYDRLHKVDSAYAYYRKYNTMKDSVALNEFSKKLAIYSAAKENEKKQTQIELLNSEKVINEQQLQLAVQRLKVQSSQKNILFAGIIILALLGFIIFRNTVLKQKNIAHQHEIIKQELNMQKLESEKTKSELQQQATDLQMRALRSQMNPHFIFNSLNSINRFIIQNNKEEASEYLTKFSMLIRLILQNSSESLITLESEIESLQLYLELEALRFDYHFEFHLNVDRDLDTSLLKVPPLIIQPFVENAIWHGLMHKEERGVLQIDLFQEEDQLCCKIADNGIGRKRAGELTGRSNSNHKSMGMSITADRIAMLQGKKPPRACISITDLVLPDGSSGGTEVTLIIPIQYD
jgi:LytS/YehU family sensor histidine kinase